MRHPRPCKEGDRIELVSMEQDPDPIAPGSQGQVLEAHYVGYLQFWQIAVRWDATGRVRMLVHPPDKIKVLETSNDSS